MVKIQHIFILITLNFVLQTSNCTAQDDLLDLLEDEEDTVQVSEKVYATFKSIKLINAQSTETIKEKTLIFRITHRFGNIGAQSGGGVHTLYGFDNATNIRFSFDYGLTDKILLGFARNKVKEHLDGSIKFKALEQTTDNKMPVTISLYSNMAFTPAKDTLKTLHRFSYVFQAIIARKISSRISIEVLPILVHRNYIVALVNDTNGAEETNDLFSLGFAGRFKITKRTAVVAEYFYTFSDYRKNNPTTSYYAPFGIGIEIETGGHVFHLNLTNSAGIIENDYIPNTTESWLNGAYKFGFNISRVFYF